MGGQTQAEENKQYQKIGDARVESVNTICIMFTTLPSRGFVMEWKDNTIGQQKNVAFNSKPRFNRQSAAQRSRPVDNLLNFLFEFHSTKQSQN